MIDYTHQSTEHYKGFDLVIETYSLDHIRTHRKCTIFYNGKSLGVSRTKKELKDLIDHGLYDKYKNPIS